MSHVEICSVYIGESGANVDCAIRNVIALRALHLVHYLKVCAVPLEVSRATRKFELRPVGLLPKALNLV